MKKELTADEQMKKLIADFEAGVESFDGDPEFELKLPGFDGAEIDPSISVSVNEFGEIIREKKEVSPKGVEKVSALDLERIKNEMASERKSEIVAELE